MAIPLMRQILECRAGFIFEKVDSRFESQYNNTIPQDRQSMMIATEKRERIIAEARNLAHRMEALLQGYQSLVSAEDLAEWCKYFLNCCADLISLALRPSLEQLEAG